MQRVTTVCSIPVVAKDLQVIVAGKKCYKTYSQELLQNKMFFFPTLQMQLLALAYLRQPGASA